MIKPTPIKIFCKDCGYQDIFTPQRGSLLAMKYSRKFCSECGSHNVEVENHVTIFDKFFVALCK